MIRLFAVCFLALGLITVPEPLGAQAASGDEEVREMTAEEKVFHNRYMNPRSGKFNSRARAVVNPHPYPRPKLSPVYPARPGVKEKTFRQWELTSHNWRRVSNAYDPNRPVKNCGSACSPVVYVQPLPVNNCGASCYSTTTTTTTTVTTTTYTHSSPVINCGASCYPSYVQTQPKAVKKTNKTAKSSAKTSRVAKTSRPTRAVSTCGYCL